MLPIVAGCITAEEWLERGEAGRADIPRKHMALVFGMLMYEGDPEVVRLYAGARAVAGAAARAAARPSGLHQALHRGLRDGDPVRP